MKEEIEGIKENALRLALINALNKMDQESPSATRVLGTIEDLDKITPSNLYDTYLELFNSNCDIFIIGNANMDKIVEIIKDNFKNRVIKLNKPKLLVNNKTRNKYQLVKDNSNFVQSTLVMIYNINNLDNYDKDINFHVFNYILGSGGITSKLYQKLRSENSLCYSVRSLYLKYDNLLVIEVSLDKSNVKLAEKLIRKCLKEMLKGEYSEEVVSDAKKNLIFSLKTGLDNNVSILNNYVFNYFANLPLIEERIKGIMNTNKEDLIRCSKAISLNTIYIQDAGDNND